jgi:hypothetical protein
MRFHESIRHVPMISSASEGACWDMWFSLRGLTLELTGA